MFIDLHRESCNRQTTSCFWGYALKLSYSEIISILSALNGIPAESDGAFRARLRNFQRLGLPEGSKTGKGRKADYDLAMLLQLVLAVEFMQAGVSPRQTVAMITTNWERALVQLFIAATPAGFISDAENKPLLPDIALCTSPESLRDLSKEGDDRSKPGDFYFIPYDKLTEFFTDDDFFPGTGTHYRWVVILLAPLIRDVMAWLDELAGVAPIEMLQELSQMMAERGHDVDFPGQPYGDEDG